MAKISEGMQILMDDFLQAKRSFYNWDDETFKQKSENFKSNVKKVKFRSERRYSQSMGHYNYRNGKVVLDMDGSDIRSFETRGIVHELNHAFNYEKGKRLNLLDGKNIRKSAQKYQALSEIINEAETQVLFDRSYNQALGRQEPEGFSTYQDLETVFKTLCICTNQNAVQFLRGIEGKDLDEFVEDFAKNSGHTTVEAQKFIDLVSEQMEDIKKQGKKIKEFADLNNITQYQTIYDMSASYIEDSSFDEHSRREMQEKLISIQPEVIGNILGLFDISMDVRNQLADRIKLVDVPEVDNGAKFEWGDARTGIKMPQRYVNLDGKNINTQLILGNANYNVRTSGQQVLDSKTYQTPEISDGAARVPESMKTSPGHVQLTYVNMSDLTKINSDEEMAKNYMKIENDSRSYQQITPQEPLQPYSNSTR